VIGFPLLLVPFAIYNMIVFLVGVDWTTKLYRVPLTSGLIWEPTAADAFIAFSLLMLMIEFIKSTRQGKSLVEHFLSLLLAGGAVAEFVMVDPAKVMQSSAASPAGNSVLFILIAICFVDLFAGFAASLRRARRTVVVEPVPVAPVAPVAPVPPPVPQTVKLETVARTDPFEPRSEPVVRVEPSEKIP
jgi:hypothetical protein